MSDLDDVFRDAAPNCAVDLVPLQPAGTADHPYWECPVCGRVSIAE